MCKFKFIKIGFTAIGIGLSFLLIHMAGCANGTSASSVPSWWPKPRTFSTNPPVTKETQAPADASSASAKGKQPPVDPEAENATEKVNENLERIKAAYAKSQQEKVTARPETEQKNGDAASKDESFSMVPKDKTVSAEEKTVTANQPSETAQRPVITPIRRSAAITGVEPVRGRTRTKASSTPIKMEVNKAGEPELKPAAEPKADAGEVKTTPKAETKTKPEISETADGKVNEDATEKKAEQQPKAMSLTVSPVAQKAEVKLEVEHSVVKTVQPANQGLKLNIPDPESANASMDKLIQKLEKKLKERPGDTATQVKLHLIYAMLGQWQEALKNSGGKDSTGGELAKNLAALVKVFDDSELSSAEQANQALKLLNNLQDLLRRQADLKVNNIQFCREVVNFGCYKLMPLEYFVSGKRLPVIVYFELDNFTSKKVSTDSYQTLLSVTMEILNREGKVCWQQHDEKIEDLANKQRRDFYIARLVTLPAGLPSGKLQLKVTVEDLNGNKVSQKIMPFELK